MNVRLDARATEIATPILRENLQPFGLEDISIKDEVDFDGEHILRVVATVTAAVPARKLLDTTDAIRVALLDEGDERYVYLGTRRLVPEIAPEDYEA